MILLSSNSILQISSIKHDDNTLYSISNCNRSIEMKSESLKWKTYQKEETKGFTVYFRIKNLETINNFIDST